MQLFVGTSAACGAPDAHADPELRFTDAFFTGRQAREAFS
jgi:hypothetical protein